MSTRQLVEDPVMWFDHTGRCQCGKDATGILRGKRNESFGVYCTKCAMSRLARADKIRAALSRPNAAEEAP